MVYRVIGLMSGSSLDGLDIACAEFREQAGKWSFEIVQADCFPYNEEWKNRLQDAIGLPALHYQLLHADYGHYIGKEVNKFIEAHQLHYQVALIASHGHTSFHIPAKRMTAQLGDGAAIAAETKLPVVTDLRSLDIAFGGQGAPIVPIGEKLLLGDYDFFLNLGGIANISYQAGSSSGKGPVAFDICPANRVLNMLANELGKEYDDGGQLAKSGKTDNALLEKLNALDYYQQPFPKSLANDFGTDIVYPMVRAADVSIPDALRTFTEHIAVQIDDTISLLKNGQPATRAQQILITGGGAFNDFLLQRLSDLLGKQQVEIVIPDKKLVNFKEALIMAFMGVLRWRQEYNVLSSVTGAAKDSIGGALWTGQDA